MNCDICKSRKAAFCIEIWAFSESLGTDASHVCKRCAKMFADLLHNPKKMLERTVRPECSNINSVSEVSTAGVPLND